MEALRDGDLQTLAELASVAPRAEIPKSSAAVAAFGARSQTAARLLGLTACNLALLRRACRFGTEYGSPIGRDNYR